MEKMFMRLTIGAAVIVIGLTLACIAFPSVRELLPDWLVYQND